MLMVVAAYTTILGANSTKLTGTIIGTAESFDYGPFQCSYTVNTIANAFDGNLNTIFATCQRTGGWVGLDLGEKHVITKVGFCPRAAHTSRMLLGVFEGANNPDFGDAVPIYLIDEIPVDNQLTYADVSSSRGFRYVRYVGPNDVKCNLAELEFYGYPGEGDDSKLAQMTNIPDVIIHTVDAQDIVEKETYLKGIVSIISEDGTKVFTDSLEIRGRGNASWSFPKKPYRMKLYNKATLLDGKAKEKNWTLINNYGDKTLIRNLLAFDLSKRFGFNYTPHGQLVNVFLNGEYKGCYQLCDQLEVAEGRVETDEMKKSHTSLPELSGGYLLEMDAYANDDTESSWFASRRDRIPVTIKYPKDDKIVAQQTNYIVSHFNQMESAIYASNYTHPTQGYRQYFDTETFLKHFLVGEISGNTDTYWSTYMYKLRSDDKFYFGPVWDFDIAFENDSRTYPINNKPDWVYTFGSTANGVRDMVNRLFSDQQLQNELTDLYASYRDNGTISKDILTAVVDSLVLEIQASQRLNFIRWNILNTKVHQNIFALGSYEAEIAHLTTYIRNRIDWIDDKLEYEPNAVDVERENLPYVWVENAQLFLSNLGENMEVSIYNISGQNLYHAKEISNSLNMQLPQGAYLVHLKSADKQTKILKTVIF